MSIVCMTMGKSVAPHSFCPQSTESEILKISFEEIAFNTLNSECCVKGIKRLEPSDSQVVYCLPHYPSACL